MIIFVKELIARQNSTSILNAMIKDFEIIKGQLQELSDIVNSFKSEAVQLKIIEMLLVEGNKFKDQEGSAISEVPDAFTNQPPKGTIEKRKKRGSKSKIEKEGEKKSSVPKGRPGPNPTLNKLVDENFFKTKKTIRDVIDYVKVNLAYTFKQSDFSGPLGRLVRENKLKREQNPDTKQYEYINY
jgi:hypothetical protein